MPILSGLEIQLNHSGGQPGQTCIVNLIQRLLFGAAGAGALAVGVMRYRGAPSSAQQAAEVGMIPRPFRSVLTYRLAAAFTGAVGAVFMLLAVLAR